MVHLFMDKYFNLMDHLDYSQALLRFQGTRRHFFRDKLYHITVFNQFFVMGEVFISSSFRRPPPIDPNTGSSLTSKQKLAGNFSSRAKTLC